MKGNESRNDVFSALFCFFVVAPLYLIYDYACELGKYCKKREPFFFRDTIFLVDKFHSKGHKDCGTASSVDPHLKVNSYISNVNTIAAEISNASLGNF